MLNNFSKFITPGQLKFAGVGLLATFGMVGLGAVSGQNKMLVKSTAVAANLQLSTNQIQSSEIQSSEKTSLLSKLREIREQKSQLHTDEFDSNNLEKIEQVFSEPENKNVNIVPTTRNNLGLSIPVNLPQKDGIYLYGQSSTPNQLGQGYIVFQKQQGQVIGALYMPSSEFSCFQGTIAKSGELAMTVRSSPGEVGAIQVSTTSRIPQITDEDAISYAYSVALQDYHPLKTISANDRKILQMCNQE
ncbi:hypothetical protein [Trichormus sp. NMC-1]|uniref:hypothetical protein n=1 Tax=Trichormus sp. NMC-1 TaxID=1853259 RepID=UPI0008DBFE41|nr:hypothetical protein [Trichormus sp. NMC-1]